MATEVVRALFPAQPSLEGLPIGSFRYAELRFPRRTLPPEIVELFEKMSEGIEEPRLTYHFQHLEVGGRFGHGRWHCDGREEPDEIHRLLTIGGEPTIGLPQSLKGSEQIALHAGTVWEYSGAFLHRAQPVKESCWRLMMRVSKTNMLYRNHWSRR